MANADLADANLRGANLSHANLAGANLRGANLTDTDLTDTDLTNTNLTGAVLDGVRWTVPGTRWPSGLAAMMRARSREVEPGVWEVAGAGGRDRPPVPAR